MGERVVDSDVAQLLLALDEGFNVPAWHGPNLRGSIRGVAFTQAAWRPAPGERNIHELAIHAAYWKYVVLRGLRGDERGSFPRKGTNWFVRPDHSLSETARGREWKADVALLDEMHAALRAAVAALVSADLPRMLTPQLSTATLIRGIAAHDVYHAGQIQTLKHLYKAASANSPK